MSGWAAEIEEEFSNLNKARRLAREHWELAQVLRAYKAAFADDELEGGWRAALTHPTYVQAEARIKAIEDELKGLI